MADVLLVIAWVLGVVSGYLIIVVGGVIYLIIDKIVEVIQNGRDV